MSSRLPRLLIAALLGLLLLWVAALGVLVRGRHVSAFPVAEAIDARFSARPGVNLSRVDLGAGLDATLARLASQGIVYVRFTVPWDEVEPAQGQFAWQPWDTVADAFARQPSLHPVVVLGRSPAWSRAAADADNPLAPPHERRDYGAFVSAVAARYTGRFTYYQVWDEPNIAPHWGVRPADPVDYLGLLREAAVNLRGVDPSAKVIAAALAPTSEGGGANLSDITYLDQLYGLGGRAWFDYPAAEPYGFDEGPDAPADPGRLNFARAALLRQVMLRHGDGGTPLWATAFGWSAADSPWGGVGEPAQVQYTQEALARAVREWPWLGPLIWSANFAPADGTAAVLAQASDGPDVLGPGRHAADDPALHYRGWRATLLAADPSAEGDTLDFSFVGTGVALEVQGGPYWAYLTVAIDGKAANRLPRDETGASYLVLHDPAAALRVAPLAEGLPTGEHTVQLTAHGGWGQWPLRAVVVTSGGATGNRLGLVLLALAALATVSVAAVARLGGWSRGFSRFGGSTEPPAKASIPGARGRTRVITEAAVWVLAIGLAALYLLSRSGSVNLVILALLGLLFLARPQLALPLIAASLPWWQRTSPVVRWQFGLFEVLAWLALLAWAGRGALGWLTGTRRLPAATRQAFQRTQTDRWTLLIDISVISLSVAGLLATAFAAEQGVAWREFRIVFLFGLVLYLLVTRAPGASVRGRVVLLVTGLMAGATIASLAGLWQFVTGQGRVDVEGVWRIAGFYGSPNNLALILDRAVPLVAAFFLFGLSTHAGLPRRGAGLARWFFGIVTVITLAAAVATFSKGAYLLGLPAGLAIVLVGGAWRSGRRWPLWLLLGLAAAGGLALVVLFRTPRFADLFNFEAGTSFFRLKLWRGALNMALDHPLLGVGPDNFLYAYRSHYVLPSAWQELNLSHPHNLFLDLWTRLGLVGVGAGLGSLVVAIGAGWRLLRGGRQMPGSAIDVVWPLFLGLLGGLAATVAHGLIDNSLFLPDLMGWFVAAQAIFWLYLRQARNERVGTTQGGGG